MKRKKSKRTRKRRKRNRRSLSKRQGNGKGEYKDRGSKKILKISYTPDFTGTGFIIECKGRANESFPIRWKLFKKLVMQQFPSYTLFKPQNQKECDRVIEILQSQPNT